MELKRVRREDLLAVPASALIDTGNGKIAFIDRGEGMFEAVRVIVGPRARNYYPVLSGLNQGDRVVTAGAFLLDAEAHLNPTAAAAYFGSTGHETHR
jgi:Cu(I)/Ag(I) efflux system membrane fusion protein